MAASAIGATGQTVAATEGTVETAAATGHRTGAKRQFEANSVRAVGRISRQSPLAFTPSGIAQWEATLAFPQERMGRKNTGYITLLFENELAVVASQRLRIGSQIAVEGALWGREFRDTQGRRVTETKIRVERYRENEGSDGRQNG